jgi:3-methyladenine DNA glycosylase AlkD
VAGAFVDDLIDALRASGTTERAAHDAAYLRSSRQHLGVAVPTVRRLTRDALRTTPLADRVEVRRVAEALWATGIYDACAAAVEVVRHRQRLLVVDDLSWIEVLLRNAYTWALVDELARHPVAAVAVRDDGVLPVLDAWVVDDDFWIRRSAVLGLSQLLRADRETERFFRYADLLLPEREFFIRKVLGWVARDLGHRRPDLVSQWCWRNLDGMNLVTLREAAKPLPDGADLLAAYRAMSPARRNSPG